MKILLVNKYFYLRGGSERVFFNEAELLRGRGHRVIFFSMAGAPNLPSDRSGCFIEAIDYERPGSFGKRLAAGLKIIYSREAAKKIGRLLDRERPEIAHLHNIHHQISPSILPALRDRRVPVVMTLHDYKMVCPAYTLFREGRVCEECRGGRYYRCFLHRCTKRSFPKSLLNAVEMYLHHSVLDLYRLVDVFISPSRFLRDKILEMGFRKEVVYLPYSFSLRDYRPPPGPGDGSVCYFGRLSAEKGLSTLLEAMEGIDAPVKIIGEGPAGGALRERAAGRLPSARFLGRRSGEELRSEIAASRLVVVPSRWYENRPSSVLEAFALGKPVIGSRIGGIPELVIDGETGFTFRPGDAADLREKIRALLADPGLGERMGRAGRRYVESDLDPDRYWPKLMEVYRRAGAR